MRLGDGNRDDLMTRGEFESAVRSLGVVTRGPSLRTIFDQSDRNGNGRVEYCELHAAIEGAQGGLERSWEALATTNQTMGSGGLGDSDLDICQVSPKERHAEDSAVLLLRVAGLAARSPEDRATTLAAMSQEEKSAMLAAMSPEDRAVALAAMLSEERAAALAAMSPGERAVASLAAMSAGERAAALTAVSPDERAAALAAMSVEDRAWAMASIQPFKGVHR